MLPDGLEQLTTVKMVIGAEKYFIMILLRLHDFDAGSWRTGRETTEAVLQDSGLCVVARGATRSVLWRPMRYSPLHTEGFPFRNSGFHSTDVRIRGSLLPHSGTDFPGSCGESNYLFAKHVIAKLWSYTLANELGGIFWRRRYRSSNLEFAP